MRQRAACASVDRVPGFLCSGAPRPFSLEQPQRIGCQGHVGYTIER